MRPREAPHLLGPDRGLVLREPVLRLHRPGEARSLPSKLLRSCGSCTHTNQPVKRYIPFCGKKTSLKSEFLVLFFFQNVNT